MVDLTIPVSDVVARDLTPLRAALQQAGVPVGALGVAGGRLHTYDGSGVPVDFPPAVRAQIAALVAAYVPPPPPPIPDYGSDASAPDQIADGVAQLRAYLALPSPTQAQTVAAFKLTIRAVLFILRRSGI